MHATSDTRNTLEKHLPLILGLLAALFAGRALRKLFWSLFAMYMALRCTGIHPFG